MLTPSQCIDYIFTRGEAEGLHYEILGEDTDTLIHKRDNGEVVIAFCGSNSKVDWKNNFHFWKKAYKDAEVPFTAHSGFLRCWKLIRHQVEDDVYAAKFNGPSTSCTGNSASTTKWQTARDFTITDGTNTGTASSVDGTGNVSLRLTTKIYGAVFNS